MGVYTTYTASYVYNIATINRKERNDENLAYRNDEKSKYIMVVFDDKKMQQVR